MLKNNFTSEIRKAVNNSLLIFLFTLCAALSIVSSLTFISYGLALSLIQNFYMEAWLSYLVAGLFLFVLSLICLKLFLKNPSKKKLNHLTAEESVHTSSSTSWIDIESITKNYPWSAMAIATLTGYFLTKSVKNSENNHFNPLEKIMDSLLTPVSVAFLLDHVLPFIKEYLTSLNTKNKE